MTVLGPYKYKYPIVKKCDGCGITFEIFDVKKIPQKYCSNSCYRFHLIGKTQSEETKRKRSLSLIGRKRKAFSEEWKRNIGKSGIGRRWNTERRLKFSESKKGSNTNFWKGGIHKKETYRHYQTVNYKIWREAVYKRDKFTCRKCGKMGIFLHPHHIKSYTHFPNQRYEVDNGLTLCKPCHMEYHHKGGTLPLPEIE